VSFNIIKSRSADGKYAKFVEICYYLFFFVNFLQFKIKYPCNKDVF
jgi:hypothetical protein